MGSSDFGTTRQYSLVHANEIDSVCDAFEGAWKLGDEPLIEHFLPKTDVTLRSSLLVELVRLDIHYRRGRGERPSVRDYTTRFPQYTKVLEQASDSIEQAVGVADSERPLASTIGCLELHDVVGRGTFGTVWKAWDADLGRFVAVKLSRGPLDEPRQVQLFRREARAIAQLDHPGIVRVHGFGEVEGQPYIVSQFVDGPNLKQWLARNKPTPRDAAELMRRMAEAIAHAHQQRVIHRDLKPSNVLIDASGRPHIADFGLAKHLDATETIGRPGAVMGTLAYMSPEQAAGRTDLVEERSDVYALGAIFYEMLTGSVVFPGDARSLVPRILGEEPRRLRERVPQLPQKLETICLTAVAKLPRDRYASAASFAEDLGRWLEEKPIEARPMPRWKRCWRRMQRQPALTALSFMLLVLLSVVGLFSAPDARRDERVGATFHGAGGQPWLVHIETDPPAADVTVQRIDPLTDKPLVNPETDVFGRTPLACNLKPGQYRLFASISSGEPLHAQRTMEAVRTVPRASSLPYARNYHYWKQVGEREIRWRPITLPPLSVTDSMVLIPGVEDVELSRPGLDHASPSVVDIQPFYVAPREFTSGDFERVRGEIHSRMADDPRPERPLIARFDEAMQYTEEAGGRLLTEMEFAYLSRLVAAQRGDRLQDLIDLTDLGLLEAQELADDLGRMQGVFGDQAEWVWGPPLMEEIVAAFGAESGKHADKYQLLLGGPETDDTDALVLRRTVARYSHEQPHFGFRVARSATGAE